MTLYSGIFNSINGDRKYDDWWFAKYFSTFIGNGVFPTPSTNLQVVSSSNMTVIVRPGMGWINGYFLYNDSDYEIQLDAAHSTLMRIDRIVMRLNYLTRQIEIVAKKGVESSNPVVPSLQRDSACIELALADIAITRGQTTITQSVITDQRYNSSLCGIVKGTVDQIDTTNLFAQFETAFTEWFNAMKNQLSEDAAGSLQMQINDLVLNKANTAIATTSANGLMSAADKSAFETVKANVQSLQPYFQQSNQINYDLTLLNGVTQYDATYKPRARKIGRFVEISGAVKGIMGESTKIANLPAGLRPHGAIILPQITSSSGGKIRLARWGLFSNGDLIMQNTSDGLFNVTTNTFWYFHFFYDTGKLGL